MRWPRRAGTADEDGQGERQLPSVYGAAGIAVVAAAVMQAALVVLYYSPRPKFLLGDEGRYFAEAVAIAAGNANAPTFVWPPLQAQLLGLSFWLFGTTLVPIQVLQVIFLVASGFLLRSIARQIGLSESASNLCLFAFVTYPSLVAFSHYLWPEVPHLFFALLAVRALFAGGGTNALIAGASLGVGLLFKSLLMPFLPIFVCVAARPLHNGRWRPSTAALLIAGLAVTAGPVVVGNGMGHGYWGISSSGAFNAWVGLSDRSRRNFVDSGVHDAMTVYLDSSSDARERERLVTAQVFEKVGTDGILLTVRRQAGKQFHRLLDKDSFFTDQLPDGIRPRYAGIGAVSTWLYRNLTYAVYVGLLIAAVCGMTVPVPATVRRRMFPFLIFLVGNLAIFSILHVKTRYRIQMLPPLFLYAAVAWDFLVGHLRDRAWGRSRIAIAALGTSMITWLALGPK